MHGATARGLKAYLETYGCALSQAESLMMASLLEARGVEMVSSPEEADVLIINTCIVRAETEDRMRRRITWLHRYAKAQGKRLIVAGCMARAEPYVVSRLAPSASLVSPQNIHRIVDAVLGGKRSIYLLGEKPRDMLLPAKRGLIGIVPIADGCLGDCSFCIVKWARRRLTSHPPRLVVDTVRRLVEKGAREIQVTAPDTAVYGYDLGAPLLPDLLKRISEIPGDFMVRIGMMTPNYAARIIDGLVEALRQPRIYRFLHLPLQSGDDHVLKLMRRDYSVDEYRKLVKELRSKVPGLSIATDIIIGHPGETEEAFENTLSVVRELRFERVHIAQYSIRPHTEAASMPQVPEHVKKERSIRLVELVEEIGLEIHRAYVGTVRQGLVTEKGRNNTLVARLHNYTPVIIPGAKGLLGSWRQLRITGATFYDLRGYALP